MKTKFYLPVVAALCTLGFVSCKKEGHGRHDIGYTTPATLVLNASVGANESYRLNLNLYGNGTPSITRQAGSYSISQISQDASGNNIYEYRSSLDPKAGGNTDQVVLRINALHESSGGCHNYENTDSGGEKNITINFTVN